MSSRARCLLLLLLAGAALEAGAALKPTAHFTLSELKAAPELSPKQFADLFEHFKYEYSPRVQPPDPFLADQVGDCDDYAVLGAVVLGPKGYTPRIIQVRLVGTDVAHAVCYVTEKGAYLDYNNRRYSVNLERAKPTVRAIAEKVADSFERNWVSAFEFTYSYEVPKKKILWTIVRTEPPEQDADRVATR